MYRFLVGYSIFTAVWILEILIHHFVYSSATVFDANLWSTWGTWAGAVGTFIAFIGTIWFAQSEARQRKEQEVARARLIAARISGDLQRAFSQFRHVFALLESYQPDDSANKSQGYLNVDSLKMVLDSPNLGHDVLAQLVPLQRETALRIAKAIGLLQSEIPEMARLSAGYMWSDLSPSGRTQYIDTWKEKFRQPYAMLRRSMNDLESVTITSAETGPESHIDSPSKESAFGKDDAAPAYGPDDKPFFSPH